MIIKSAEFLMSNTEVGKCPEPKFPEYAFIGRSNVGKSSLINMLTNHTKLAKISSTPGKTQLINHFLINEDWYLVDLPGYGYAKIGKEARRSWVKFVMDYLEKRSNLVGLFVLVDSRLEPQKKDLEFMEKIGLKEIPFTMIFTKTDKISKKQLDENLAVYKEKMLASVWEEMPKYFTTSAKNQNGKEEVLGFIDETNKKVDWL